MTQQWTDGEPGWAEARQELARIRRRMRTRWKATLLVTLVMTALVVLQKARSQRRYEATVVIRVTEAGFDPTAPPVSSAQLTDYFWQVAFARGRLLKVIEEHELYPDKLRMDPNFAVESMREDLDVQILRNYFAVERFSEDPMRSARVVISYSGREPQLALDAVRRLARMLAEQEMEQRRVTAEYATASSVLTASGLRAQLLRARAEQARLQLQRPEAKGDETAHIMVQLQRLAKDIEATEDQLKLVDTTSSEARLRTAYEGAQGGLRFEIVDAGRPARVTLARPLQLTILALFVFAFFLPVAGVGVAAYDLRIYDVEDLRRLGLRPFGHVPRFPGHRDGSLDQRVRKSAGAPWKS